MYNQYVPYKKSTRAFIVRVLKYKKDRAINGVPM